MSIEEHQRRLGERLRDIRHQQGMTLQDVEDASDGHWKAVVIGAYERGDRAISAPKLIELAHFYDVPVSVLLPGGEPPSEGRGARSLRLDLESLADADGPRERALQRYARDIQSRRGDFNGRVLSLRRDDLRTLAAAFEMTTAELIAWLAQDGLLAGVTDVSEHPDRLELVIRVDGQEAGRTAHVDPEDGTVRLLTDDRR